MNYSKDQLAALCNFQKEHLNNPPAEMRNIFLYLAKDAFDNGDTEHSIYFQTQLLCSSFDSKNIFKINKLDLYDNDFLRDVVLNKSSNFKKHCNSLVTFAKKNFLHEKVEISSKNLEKFNLKEKITETKNILKNMPKEWKIIQLTKGYNEKMSVQQREQNLTAKLPIYISILKHPVTEAECNVICVKLDIDDSEFYKNFFEIQEMFKSLSSENLTEETKEEYHKKTRPLEVGIISGIEKLEKTLGPWSCLFSGNLKNEDMQYHISKIVTNFCKKNKLDNNIKILLSLLLNEPKKLSQMNCKTASEYLSKGKTKKICSLIEDFLIQTSNELVNSDNLKRMELKMPCLLLIDELLDHFPWEFLNKSQEFCRISSLNVLNQIFTKHKNKIRDGYLKINVTKGNFFVNPENNLKETENRFRSFGNYWLPNFDYLFGEKPPTEKIIEIFGSNGIYVYCGHGHGMDYLNPHKLGITEIRNPVAFLFGCESVKLSSKTSYGEMIGEHLYFHKGLCPAVVGCIHIAFDYSLDLLATEILSSWITSTQKIHWNNIDKELWRKGKVVSLKKINKTKNFQYEPRLSAILSKIRESATQKFYHLTPLVYRGIPIWNEAAEEITTIILD